MNVLEMREKLGEPQLTELVERFYEQVRRDPMLAPVFAGRIAGDAWPAHLARMQAFWSTVLRGTGRYRDNPMHPHLGLDAGPEHFERWLRLFAGTARRVLGAKLAAPVLARAHRMAEQLQRAMGISR